MRCRSCDRENPDDASFCNGCGASLAEARPPTPTPQPAPVIPTSFASGRYRVQRFLGEGGKKRVYLARDTRLDTGVAIAAIKAEGLDAGGLTRIGREAQAMARLRDHPHIVTVLDIGDEAGQPFLVQEFMEGGSLEDLLREAENHRLPVGQALRIAEQVCQALEHAHGQGIIHRDLKPGNVFLTRTGDAKLGDFGLAAVTDLSRVTQEGMTVGTFAYMPPEQATGRGADARSDLYSLGCALYEMVAGRPPFAGEGAVAVVSQHINSPPVAPSWHNAEVSQPLEMLIMRLLEKSPEERPGSATSVIEELHRIAARQTEEMEEPPPPAPSAGLAAVPWGQFVGRRQEMKQLKAALESALSGRGSLVMIVGEPGIGKTRLAEEFGVYASLRGGQLLAGRCYEGEVALPYRPFVETFREYVRGRPDVELRGELGEGAPDVAKLVSEVRRRFPDIAEAPPLEPDAERLRLFESVSDFVCNAARATPLVLFLDDLQWADKPSLLMLRYVARAVARDRVLILGAYRDVELDRTHPLAEVITALRREQSYQRILLRGLPEEDVLALLMAIEPSDASAATRRALADALCQETEGNPFFVREVLSHLVEEGKLYREGGRWTTNVTSPSELGIPEGIREVVGRRLSRLSEACNRTLTLASMMTGGFSWEELKAISGEPEETLLDLLEEALAARVIDERRRDHAASYGFTHALIRQTLYGELSTPRRVVLHRQIGEALEELHADNLEPRLAELAHHFFLAAPGGDVDKAIDYATRAGDRAAELPAHEEAAGQYEMALQAVDLKDTPDDRLRYDLLMAAGWAYLRADEQEKSVPAFKRAAQLAERLGDPRLQGLVAYAYSIAAGRGPFGIQATVPVVERALQALGDVDSGLRARLLCRVAFGLGPSAPPEHHLAIAQEAKGIAERVGDFTALAESLHGLRSAKLGPEYTEERLAIDDEWIRAAEKGTEKHWVYFAHMYRLADLAELGEMEEVDHEIQLASQLADEMREPWFSAIGTAWKCMRATLEGRYEEAEHFLLQYRPVARRTRIPDLQVTAGAQNYGIRWGQGRLREIEEAVVANAKRTPDMPANQAAVALLYVETARPDEARRWYEKVATNDFADISSDEVWMWAVSLMATVARRLRDEQRAPVIYDLLKPYASRNIVVGTTIVCEGSASRPLGMLAATMGHFDDAERHFEHALASNEKIGARPWLARTEYEYADMLHDRNQTGDRTKAHALVSQALASFEELGMKKDVERALALKMELEGISSPDVKTSIDAIAASVEMERPNLRSHAAPDGTVTILFTDIEGHTALNERLGDQLWLELLSAHNAMVREQLGAHGGYEVKTMGDGFMVAFSGAGQALVCAIAIQRSLAAHNQSAKEPVFVRIGLHTGEPIAEEEDFYGTAVTIAARIGARAVGGQILASEVVRQLVSAKEFQFVDRGATVLRGFQEPTGIYEVVWDPAGIEAQKRVTPAFPDRLTRREVEVLRLIAGGKSNQDIADELVISLNTVIRHVSNIFSKTGAANRAEAAAYASRHGLLF